jgi:hypothetical protein
MNMSEVRKFFDVLLLRERLIVGKWNGTRSGNNVE